ncbi:hypothetical protein C0995_005914 [Termitomyces sp. Mi166|nr:hypothetical protein C0995_005914 [Termitomyces sp. Mi166\
MHDKLVLHRYRDINGGDPLILEARNARILRLISADQYGYIALSTWCTSAMIFPKFTSVRTSLSSMYASGTDAHPTMMNTPLDAAMSASSATPSTMDAPPPSLPSTVEETLSRCPRYEMWALGVNVIQVEQLTILHLQTGVGKSSLIANIFNVNQEDIDIADGHAGTANIDREYAFDENPRFVLHDSRGFEPGSTNNWEIVEEFIQTPRPGARLMQTADEDLLKLAITRGKIPVIVVFTKFDLLYNVFFAKAVQQGHRSIDPDQVSEAARTSLEMSIEVFRKQFDPPKPERFSWSKPYQRLSYVGVSTNQALPGRRFLHMLEELTEVTRKRLHTKETFAPWAVAQRIDPKQKAQTSIEGLMISAEYWKDMAKSTVFRGHVLKDCLWRIHLDIVKVWNFRDPEMLLTGKEFHVQMLKLIESFVPHPRSGLNAITYVPVSAALAALLGPIFPPLAIAIAAAGFTAMAVNFLYGTYRAAPETSLYLEAYIVDLTLFLHELFVIARRTEWHKPLTNATIVATLTHFEETKSERIHKLIREDAHEAVSAKKAKRNIGKLIHQELGMDRE